MMFESQLTTLSHAILAKARGALESQMLVRDMSLVGGLFIVGFMAFGVFLPAHRSTVSALDELESEKARVQKLAVCAEHTTKGIVLGDATGRVTWCNEAFCSMTGYSALEIQGKRLIQLLRHPDADETVLANIMSRLAERETVDFEILALNKFGGDFWLRGSITPVTEGKRFLRFVHAFEDVTEEREIESRLSTAREESDRLALIARHASDGMAILDAEFDIVWVNPAMSRMTGYTRDEFRSSSMHELMQGPLSDPRAIERIMTDIAVRKLVAVEVLAYPKQGTPYWIEAIHTPIFETNGDFAGYVIVHRDITERKNLELELIANRDDLAARVEERTQTIMNQSFELEKALDKERELNRMQTEFVSMASHEFRTPLTIIDGIARRIEKRADRFTPDEIREKSSTIRSTVKRMTMLVERTLDASRLSSGRIRLTPESFSLRTLIEEVCDRQREVATSHEISVDLGDLPAELFGDSRLLDNVFTNVVSNGVKYSGEKKQVRVTGCVEENYAIVRVRDTGIGIPKDELPKIFQRFFRATTSTGIPGTGIGLNLVKSLVEMHYGIVEIDSEEGEWTEFTIRLPIESPLMASPGSNAEDDEPSTDLQDTAA